MRSIISLGSIFVVALLLWSQPVASGQDRAEIDELVEKSGLGSLVDKQLIGDVIEIDKSFGQTAKELKKELKAILDANPASVQALRDQIESKFTEVKDRLDPPGRAAWFALHDDLLATIDRKVMGEPADQQLSQQIVHFKTVEAGLETLAILKQEHDDVEAPTNIVRPRFWLDAAYESQVYKYDQKPIESTKQLSELLKNFAALPPDSLSADDLKTRLDDELQRFRRKIKSERTERQYQAWRNYIRLWFNELAKPNLNRILAERF